MNKPSIIVINSHPIQYYTPLYKKFQNELDIDLQVWFCSKIGVEEYFDEEFNTKLKWDIPLLEGFKYEFLKNFSFFKINSPFIGLINLQIISKLFFIRKSIIWIDSWSQITFILAIIFGKLFGHKIYFRAETPLSHEILKNKLYLKLRIVFFKFLFMFIDKFLYIGEQNNSFYKYYGVKESKLVFMPYCIDNNYFSQLSNFKSSNLFETYKIKIDHKIIMFCGKFINKKRPLDLIKAYQNIKCKNHKISLLLVGTGPLESQIKDFVLANKIDDIHITGFVNQSMIKYFYNISDVFVMCSGSGETWGLATNEAMNFSSSIVISDLTGCSNDLVTEGLNGYKFSTGNVEELAISINNALFLDKTKIVEEHRKKLNIFSYATCVNNLKSLISNDK